jgi:hypothetical protein
VNTGHNSGQLLGVINEPVLLFGLVLFVVWMVDLLTVLGTELRTLHFLGLPSTT